MKYLVPDERILAATLIEFAYNQDGDLCILNNTDERNIGSKAIPCIFMDGHIIAINSGEELFTLKLDENGFILDELFNNTKYIDNLYTTKDVTDEIRKAATDAYIKFNEMQELEKEKKLIKFPQKRMY